MGLNATVKAPAVISGSTTTGEQAKVTRMVVPGIKGADGDITWEGEWSSSTTYTQNEAVQYNGSAYVCLQGNSNLIPPNNTSAWSLMTSKGDTGLLVQLEAQEQLLLEQQLQDHLVVTRQ